MTPRLLFASTEPSSVGGSSTASHALFRRLRSDGWDAHHVTVIDEDDAPYYGSVGIHEPRSGGAGHAHGESRVSRCWLRGPLHGPHPELRAVIDKVDPAIVVGFGYLAAGLLAGAASGRRVVLITGTCRQAQDYVTSGRAHDATALAAQLAAQPEAPYVVNGVEQRAVERCDLIVTHSGLALDMMQRFFPSATGRIYPRAISFAEWICDDAAAWRSRARPFDARDIDVLFVASDWNRPEKNYPLVRALARRLPNLRVHVVGEVPSHIRSATHHGFLASREHVFDLIGRARSVVCPSRIDAAPGILFEASVMDCNLIASRACGNWEICAPELVADAVDADAFARCMGLARTRRYDDRLQTLLDRQGYRELGALLAALDVPLVSRVAW